MNALGMAEQSDAQRRWFEEQAVDIVAAAGEQGLTLRLLGSLAFRLHCHEYGHLQKQLGRAYTDLDFAAYGAQASRITPFFTALGYREDAEVNLYYAGQRMIYHHPQNGLHVDVFFDKLDFCHTIHWSGRLGLDSPTIPLAELLLEKMQIVKINEKDVIDTIMLLLEHSLGDHDHETINIALIGKECARDWGLYRTVTMNLEKVAQLCHSYGILSEAQKKKLEALVQQALQTINAQPKSLAWKIRSRIGDRMKWYQEVEEVS